MTLEARSGFHLLYSLDLSFHSSVHQNRTKVEAKANISFHVSLIMGGFLLNSSVKWIRLYTLEARVKCERTFTLSKNER